MKLSQTQHSLPEKTTSAVNSIDPFTKEKIRAELIILINELINQDFQSLTQLLYRIDVNEKKIRLHLEKNSDKDAATVLADLIIERQLQKIESRKKHSRKNTGTDDEEKW